MVEGTSRPCRFPAVSRPMIRVPAMEVCTTGMTSPNSASKTEKKLAEPVDWDARQ